MDGSCFFPGTNYILLRSKRRSTLHSKHTNLRILTAKNIHVGILYRLILNSFHGHFHVALTGTKPYLAYQNIVQCFFSSIIECNCIRPSCLRGSHRKFPRTAFISSSRVLFSVPTGSYCHLFMRSCRSPKIGIRLLLHDHAIREDSGQFYFCICRQASA